MKKVPKLMLTTLALAVVMFSLVQCNPKPVTNKPDWSGPSSVGTTVTTANDIIVPITNYISRNSIVNGIYATSYVLPPAIVNYIIAGNTIKIINAINTSNGFVIVPTDKNNNTNWKTVTYYTDPVRQTQYNFPVYCTSLQNDGVEGGVVKPSTIADSKILEANITEDMAKGYIAKYNQTQYPTQTTTFYQSAYSSVSIRKENLPATDADFKYIRIFYAYNSAGMDGIIITASKADGTINVNSAVTNYQDGLCPTNCDMY